MILAIFYTHFCSIKNSIKYFREKSPARFFYGLFFVIFGVIGLYAAMWGTFHYIVSLGGVGRIILKKIIYIMFSILFFMVSVSFAVLFYGLCFCGRETAFFLSMPIARSRILMYKFAESALLAGWIPLLGTLFYYLAYIQVGSKSPLLVAASPLFTIPALCISCFLGYILLILILRSGNLQKVALCAGVLL